LAKRSGGEIPGVLAKTLKPLSSINLTLLRGNGSPHIEAEKASILTGLPKSHLETCADKGLDGRGFNNHPD